MNNNVPIPNNNNDHEELPQRNAPPSRGFVIGRYLVLGVMAVVGTIACPGDTLLWNSSDSSMNRQPLAMILLSLIFSLVSFGALQGSDPGYLTEEIISRLSLQEDDYNNREGEEEEAFEQNRRTQIMEQMECMPALDSSSFTSLCRKRCDICGFSPPLRSHHCKDCNQCVACFDHHCGFVGTCIGELNHCRFYIFLTMQLFVLGFCTNIVNSSSFGCISLLLLDENDNNDKKDMLILSMAQVCATKIYTGVLFSCALLIWIIHSFLAVTNSTTFEFTKGGRHLEYLQNTHPMDCPMSQGACRNLYLFCCQKDAGCHCHRRRRGSFQPIVWRPPQISSSSRAILSRRR